MINLNSTTADSLQKKGDKILGVFTKTREELIILQEQQQNYSKAVDQKISELTAEKEKNEKSIDRTSTVLKKIDEFLS